ncbi:MAG: BamA/TamA family outer membrane protein [Flavobacteriaceae bacterium]|jgi:outer membrane translocation and assembly module TamA|nr:BamA/TamA family outer membrane protein [Flavobacteriaceae bacterium]
MKFRLLLWVLFFSNLFCGQEKKEILKVYNGRQLWFTHALSESKVNSVLDSLVNMGFYALKVDSLKKEQDEVSIYITRGNFYKKMVVQPDSLSRLAVRIKEEHITTTNIDSLANVIHYYYLKKGYAFNKVFTDLDFTENPIRATISVELNQKRIINSFVINGYTKFPGGIKKELEYDFIGKPYDDSKLKEISNKLTGSLFIAEEKSPQVLFTPDSTTIFLYLKKRKSSSFNGIMGFGNDESGKFKLNGQVQLSLGNVFNSFETIDLNWLATPDESQNFEIQVNVPYLFKSKFGTETGLNIYKQDSTYASIKIREHIYYQYTSRQQIGVEGSFENSRNVLDSDKNTNFSKTGLGVTYQYLEKNEWNILGPKNLYLLKGVVYRNVPEDRDNVDEYQLSAHLEKLVKISGSHYLKPRISASALLSDTLTINELFRIGGLKTVRGFNEQSVYANAYVIGSLEYRYVPFEEMFLNVFTDFALVENKYQNSNSFIFGTGLGISFLTRFGIFSLNYALGKYESEPVNLSDSKIHIGIQANF